LNKYIYIITNIKFILFILSIIIKYTVKFGRITIEKIGLFIFTFTDITFKKMEIVISIEIKFLKKEFSFYLFLPINMN
jgi:hypothetical protein